MVVGAEHEIGQANPRSQLVHQIGEVAREVRGRAIGLDQHTVLVVFYSTKSLPGVLKGIAVALPLKHEIDGMHGAIVTGAGLGDHLTALAVVGVWAAVGLVLCFFRWE